MSLAVPGVAHARPDDGRAHEDISATAVIEGGEPLDNDALFDEYVHRLFYGDSGIQPFGTSGRDQLSEGTLELYDVLLATSQSIASGERDRTDEIALPVKTWTLEELGVSAGDSNWGSVAVAAYKVWADHSAALDALLDDRPFDLYWYDKTGRTEAGAFAIGYSLKNDGTSVTVTPTAKMAVADEYRADGDPFAVDTTKVQAAEMAAERARAIVNEHANLGDYDKLVAYRDAICELVNYNDEAADAEDPLYGDPWQLVYVFDGDDETKVVCEGYAKAFQYLCDLSQFDPEIRCTTVHGMMFSLTGMGRHMWNIVRMGDGRNYLVDVTNSDSGSIGENGGLFIASYAKAEGDYEEGYTFQAGSFSVTYTYDDDTIALYPESYLALSSQPYDDGGDADDTDLSNAEVRVSGDYTYDGAPQVPSPADVTVTLGGEVVPTEAYDISVRDNTDAGTATITVTAKEGKGFSGSATGTFVIQKATPKVEVGHTGGVIYPTTPLEDIEENLKVEGGVSGTVSLMDATLAVGENVLTWVFTPSDEGNYNAATGTVKIAVSEDTIKDIAVTTLPAKTSYAHGDVFDPEGMVVTATYASGRTEPVLDYSIDPTGALVTVGKNAITIEYKGMTAEIFVNVSSEAVTPDVKPEPVTMYRLYNSYTGEHFYTASASERDGLVAVGWADEGLGWVAPASGDPVYRLYNPYVAGGDHHYTPSASERDSLVDQGWRYEGVGWYSAPAATGVPLYRQYNPFAKTGTHNYTTSRAENDHLVSVGWREEGVGWYGIG